jgi:hypothetical protein
MTAALIVGAVWAGIATLVIVLCRLAATADRHALREWLPRHELREREHEMALALIEEAERALQDESQQTQAGRNRPC